MKDLFIKIFLLCKQTKMLMDDCSDDSDCGTNYDSGKGGSYLDVYKLSKSTPMICLLRINRVYGVHVEYVPLLTPFI